MFKTELIILKTAIVQEYDLRITAYCALLGKINAVARGYHRTESRLRGHLDVLDYAQGIVLTSNYLPYIRSVISRHKWPKIRRKQNLLYAALCACEIYDKLLPLEQPDTRLWQILLDYLNTLEKNPQGKNISAQFLNFINLFWQANGYGDAKWKNTAAFMRHIQSEFNQTLLMANNP